MYSVCIYLLKVVGYYDLSVLSMSVIGFQKKSLDRAWVGGWGELYPIFFGFLEFFKLCKAPILIADKRFSPGEKGRMVLSGSRVHGSLHRPTQR